MLEIVQWVYGMELLQSVQVRKCMLTYSTLYLSDNVSVLGQPVFLSLRGLSYATNNNNILVTRIGTTNDTSLTCHTDSTTCCRGVDNGDPSSLIGTGEWLFPNGTSIVRNRVTGSGFYYTRFHQVLRLYHQGDTDTQTPLGSYCCKIPDSGEEIRTFCANLIGEFIMYRKRIILLM